MGHFKKATKKKRKLRLAIFGPSGSGKTYSALRVATGFGGSIAYIDTENSAELYADKFSFDIAPLREPTIENLLAYIEEAHDYKVLVIDSFSHSWRELLDEVNRVAKAKYSGNTWSAWSDGTPKQNKLIHALLNFPGHLIVCMRSKTEWVIQKDDRTGKNKPERVGLNPEQGKGIEYEFDMLFELSPDHVANVIKDRTGKYQDKLIELPDEKLGQQLIDWLNSGEEIPEIEPVNGELINDNQRKRMFAIANENNVSNENLKNLLEKQFGYTSSKDIAKSDYEAVCAMIESISQTQAETNKDLFKEEANAQNIE